MATEATTPEDLIEDSPQPPALPYGSQPGRGLVLPHPRAGRRTVAVLSFVADWSGLLLAAALGLASGLIYVRTTDIVMLTFDDSFISLNFARNLAEHGMLSFDGEHWSGGATSPLHVALLALVLKAGAAPIFASVAFGVAMHALLSASVWLLTLAVFRSRVAAMLGAFAIAFTPFAALDVVNGMETGLFMSLVTLTCACYLVSRSRRGLALTGLLVALTILTRPEGAFLLPALVIYHFVVQPKRAPLLEYLNDAAVLCTLPLIALGSLAAYSYAVNGTLGGTATVKLQFFREFALGIDSKIDLATDQIGLFMGPLAGLIGLAIVSVRRREAVLVALFWLPVMTLFVLLFPGSLYHYFFRYQHPIMPFLALFAAGGAYQLLSAASVGTWATKALVVAVLVVAIVPVAYQYERWRLASGQAVRETSEDMVAMAKELDGLILPSQTLAAHDVGAVSYFGRYKVLDLVGLMNPGVVPYHHDRSLRAYIQKERPDFILMFPEWDRNYLLLDPWHHPERYQWVAGYPGGHLRRYTFFLYRIVYPEYTVTVPTEAEALRAEAGPASPAVAPQPFVPSKIAPPRTGDAGLLSGARD